MLSMKRHFLSGGEDICLAGVKNFKLFRSEAATF